MNHPDTQDVQRHIERSLHPIRCELVRMKMKHRDALKVIYLLCGFVVWFALVQREWSSWITVPLFFAIFVLAGYLADQTCGYKQSEMEEPALPD